MKYRRGSRTGSSRSGRQGGLALDDVGGMGKLDRFIRAGRVDGPAALGQSIGDRPHLGTPQVGGDISGGYLGELTAQQDQPQDVAKDDPLLLDEVARLHEFVEVAAEAE